MVSAAAAASITAICMENYGFIYRYCEHVVPLPCSSEDNKVFLSALYAIGLFVNDSYNEAANLLLTLNYAKHEAVLRRVMTPTDYAYFISLSSLASFSRVLLKQVNDNPNLNVVIESVPELQGLVNNFLTSRYKEMWKQLADIRAGTKYNCVLLAKLDNLMNRITEKMISQYCLPYKSVDLKTMAAALGVGLGDLEEKLVGMSAAGLLKGKIDSHNKVPSPRPCRSCTSERKM